MKPEVIPVPLGPFGMVNAFLLRGERTILVDTGVPGSGEAILAAMKRNRIDPRAVSLILITHGHFDHMGSASDLRERLGAPAAVGESDLQALRTGVPPPLTPTCLFGRFARPFLDRRMVRRMEPDIVIIRGMSLAEFGIEGKVIETPGHTAGSVSVILPTGPAIVGDLLCGGMLRRTRPALPPFQDDIAQTRESLRKVLKSKPTAIHVGHGGPLSPSAARAFLESDRAFAATPAPHPAGR